MRDTAYREIIENSATYNTRLCIERKLRMPFLDAQTGKMFVIFLLKRYFVELILTNLH